MQWPLNVLGKIKSHSGGGTLGQCRHTWNNSEQQTFFDAVLRLQASSSFFFFFISAKYPAANQELRHVSSSLHHFKQEGARESERNGEREGDAGWSVTQRVRKKKREKKNPAQQRERSAEWNGEPEQAACPPTPLIISHQQLRDG